VLNQTVPAGKEKAAAEWADSTKAKMNERKKMFFIPTKKRNFEKKAGIQTKKKNYSFIFSKFAKLKIHPWNRALTIFTK
jgi:hypothetical protein